jgi:hypothetical protein
MTGWSRQPVAPGAAIPILLSAVGVANLMFRILANLQFGEDLEQSSLSEHGEARQAFAHMAEQRHFGKLVINVAGG